MWRSRPWTTCALTLEPDWNLDGISWVDGCSTTDVARLDRSTIKAPCFPIPEPVISRSPASPPMPPSRCSTPLAGPYTRPNPVTHAYCVPHSRPRRLPHPHCRWRATTHPALGPPVISGICRYRADTTPGRRRYPPRGERTGSHVFPELAFDHLEVLDPRVIEALDDVRASRILLERNHRAGPPRRQAARREAPAQMVHDLHLNRSVEVAK